MICLFQVIICSPPLPLTKDMAIYRHTYPAIPLS